MQLVWKIPHQIKHNQLQRWPPRPSCSLACGQCPALTPWALHWQPNNCTQETRTGCSLPCLQSVHNLQAWQIFSTWFGPKVKDSQAQTTHEHDQVLTLRLISATRLSPTLGLVSPFCNALATCFCCRGFSSDPVPATSSCSVLSPGPGGSNPSKPLPGRAVHVVNHTLLPCCRAWQSWLNSLKEASSWTYASGRMQF